MLTRVTFLLYIFHVVRFVSQTKFLCCCFANSEIFSCIPSNYFPRCAQKKSNMDRHFYSLALKFKVVKLPNYHIMSYCE